MADGVDNKTDIAMCPVWNLSMLAYCLGSEALSYQVRAKMMLHVKVDSQCEERNLKRRPHRPNTGPRSVASTRTAVVFTSTMLGVLACEEGKAHGVQRDRPQGKRDDGVKTKAAGVWFGG